jgi:hypothetical protein
MAKTHPVIAELGDGGRIEVTDRELVPMGDELAASQITYSHPGDAERAARVIVFEIRRGVPVCVSVQLSATAEAAVRTKDLKAMELENLRRDIYGYVGVWRTDPETGDLVRVIRADGFRADSKAADKAIRQGRRKITDEFLKRVTEVHNNAPAGGKLAAVMAAFNVYERQAIRYKREAEKRGFVNDQAATTATPDSQVRGDRQAHRQSGCALPVDGRRRHRPGIG